MRHVPPLTPTTQQSTLLYWSTDADLVLRTWSAAVDQMAGAAVTHGNSVDVLIQALGFPDILVAAHDAARGGVVSRYDLAWNGGSLSVEVRPGEAFGTRGVARFDPSSNGESGSSRIATLDVQGGVIVHCDAEAPLVFGRSKLIGVPLEVLLDAEFDESMAAAFDGRTESVPLVRYHSGRESAGLAEVHFEPLGEHADAVWRLTFYPLAEQPEAQRELARLASYAQNHPHPIVEITPSGTVRFVNDAAHRSLPELAERGLSHPFLSDMPLISTASEAQTTISRTVLLPDGRRFEQEVRRMAGGNVRVFAHEVTSASNAAAALRDQAMQRSVLNDSLVYQRDLARTLMGTLALPVFVVDASGLPTYANYAAAAFTGVPMSNMSGRLFLDFVHPDDRERTYQQFRQRAQRGGGRYEIRLLHADGSFRPGLVTAAPLSHADGSYAGSIATFTDLTEQAEHQHHVETLRRFYESVLAELPIEVSVLDADGCYLYLNAEAVRNPIRREALIGKRPGDVTSPSETETHVMRARQRWIETIVRTRKRISVVERRNTDDLGHTQLVQQTGIPLLAEDGHVTFVVVYGVDIGEQVVHERELTAARRAAEEMNTLKTTLVTNMSHEIRTPLTVIIGFADFLSEDLPPDTDREPLALIKSSGERLLDMLNDILDSARLAAHSFRLDVRPYDVREVARSVANLFRPEAEERGLFVTCRVPSSPARAAVNIDALRRAVSHLVSNAVRFTQHGGVEVDVRNEQNSVAIVVTDSGVGIDPALLPSLFEPFSQGSTGDTRSHQGNGLGLSIARGLTETMGGTISVDSRIGAGSTFMLRFPRLADTAP